MYRQPQREQYDVTYLREQSDYALKIACTTLNFFLFALSIAIFAVGIWLSVWTTGFNTIGVIMNVDYHMASYILLIISGSLLMIISFVGMCGSQKESVPQLLAFIIVVILSGLMLISAAGLGIALNSILNTDLATNMSLAISQMYGVNQYVARNLAVTNAIDLMQQTYSCCGVIGNINSTTSWQIYQSSAWILTMNHNPPYVPASCCVRNVLNLYSDISTCQGNRTILGQPKPPVVNNGVSNDYLNVKGCVTEMTSTVNYFSLVVFGLGLGSFLYVILILVLSCYLVRRIEVAKYVLARDPGASTSKLQVSEQNLRSNVTKPKPLRNSSAW